MFKILLPAGILLILFGVLTFSDHARFASSSIRVMAEVVDQTPVTFLMRVPQSRRVTLRYALGSEVIELSTRIGHAYWPAIQKGSQVQIIVQESNYKKILPVEALPDAKPMSAFYIFLGSALIALALFQRR